MSIQHENEPNGNATREAYAKYIGAGLQTYTPTQAVVERAKGVYLWTTDGKRLLDFTSGVLVTNLGHAHKGFNKRWAKYLDKLPMSSYNMITGIEVEASRRVLESMDSPKAEKLLWAASGSEGVQKAMWAALHRHPERHILAATRGGFHGKKGLAGEVTGESSVNPNVRFVSFPLHTPESEDFYKNELAALWDQHPNDIALFITEPYLGAKGSFHPPAWYHQLVQAWCNEHDIPLIFDEVQACFGRTGSMYAFQSYGVQPDLVVLGKGLANGEPAAAVAGRADLIESLKYGEASDTFSATPMACAAVCATLDIFEEDKIVKHCRKMAAVMAEILQALREKFPFIVDVRGEGLVYGIDCESSEIANRCVLEAYRGNGRKGVHFLGPLAEKVLRVSPPLTITAEEIEEAAAILNKAWKRI